MRAVARGLQESPERAPPPAENMGFRSIRLMIQLAQRTVLRTIGIVLAVVAPVGVASGAPPVAPLAEYGFKPSTAADEQLIFTPPGFEKAGVPAKAEGADVAHLTLAVKEA